MPWGNPGKPQVPKFVPVYRPMTASCGWWTISPELLRNHVKGCAQCSSFVANATTGGPLTGTGSQNGARPAAHTDTMNSPVYGLLAHPGE